MKINFGAGKNWQKENWYIVDHNIKKKDPNSILFKNLKIFCKDNTVDVIYASHVFEHISHYELPLIISELNRILKKNGVLRIAIPDLEKICKAYVKKDKKFFSKILKESKNPRLDLGPGGTLMNFIISPGQDTLLFDKKMERFIGGYAHVYAYDFLMMSKILKKLGFRVTKSSFCKSKLKELRIPLHVKGLEPIYQNFNKSFYKKNKLIHKQVKGGYKTNFKLTGFDKDPVQTLFIEAKKVRYVNKTKANKIFNYSKLNYNRYSKSILFDTTIKKKINKYKIQVTEDLLY